MTIWLRLAEPNHYGNRMLLDLSLPPAEESL
jgi:hypothetical protein